MLTKEEIRKILEELRWVTLYIRADSTQQIRLQERTASGYSHDPERARLQGKLSIMLEAAPGK